MSITINDTFLGMQRVRNVVLLTLAFIAALSWSFMALTRSAGATYLCGFNNLCLFTDAHFQGLVTEYYSPLHGCHNLSSTFNDKVSSIDNWSSHTMQFYKDYNCSNFFALTIEGGGDASNLANTSYNDQISSFWVN